MFDISVLPQMKTTVLIFTLGAYDQFFDVQILRVSESRRKYPKTTQFALFRGQGYAKGKVS